MSALSEANDRTSAAHQRYESAMRTLAYDALIYVDKLDRGDEDGAAHTLGLMREDRAAVAVAEAEWHAAVEAASTISTHRRAGRALIAAGAAGCAVKPMAAAA